MATPQSIDDFLGISQQRYFGAGYKQVRHSIQDIHFDPSNRLFDAQVCIEYPTSWSKKKTSSELKPHLSTIDVFVIAAQMCDAFMSHCFKMSEGASKQAWLRSLAVKAGRESVLDLSEIPLNGELVSCKKTDESLNGFITEFKLQLGGFSLNLEVDHGRLESNCSVAPIAFKTLEEFLGGDKSTFYGNQYAHITHQIMVDSVSPTEIQSHLKMEKASEYNPSAGLGAAYSGCHSPLDLMICGAQLSQVLVYQIDDLTRENTKNLWMRSVKVFCPNPLVKGGSLPITVATRKTRLIAKGNEHWRMADLKATSPLDSEFYMESSVAHEIHEALNNAEV